MDDLVTIPATARLTLTTLSRLGRLEPPMAASSAASPQPLPLASWARAIGSSTDQASIAEADGGSFRAGVRGSTALAATHEDGFLADRNRLDRSPDVHFPKLPASAGLQSNQITIDTTDDIGAIAIG